MQGFTSGMNAFIHMDISTGNFIGNNEMKVSTDCTDIGLAKVIDEVTKAKSIIKLDTLDFRDILSHNGDVTTIAVEESSNATDFFPSMCDTISRNIQNLLSGRQIDTMIVFIFMVKGQPLMMQDMNHATRMIGNIPAEHATIKWGIGESDDANSKMIVIFNLR